MDYNQMNLVSLKDLAQILGKSENSLRYHLRMGRFSPTVRYGRVMSFNPNKVIEQLQRGVKAPR